MVVVVVMVGDGGGGGGGGGSDSSVVVGVGGGSRPRLWWCGAQRSGTARVGGVKPCAALKVVERW